MEWVRVKDVTPYINAEQYSEEFGLVKRLYSVKGKEYPLLSVAIYGNFSHSQSENKGIRIDISFKEKEDSWWDSSSLNDCAYISLELFDDLREMLKEAEEKLESFNV